MIPKDSFAWLRVRGAFVFALLFLTAISAFGQASTGVILGTIKDSTGGTVAGATVTVTSVDTGQARTQVTGDDGAYRFNALLVGNYSVSVTKEGFQTYQRTGLDLVIGQEAVIDATLTVGATGQTVTVTGEAPVVDTTSATLGTVVDETKVEDLPLNGRNFVDLTLLQPGVAQTSITTGPYGMGGTMYSSNGATLRSNMTTIDGANMTTLMGLSSTSAIFTTLGIDGIKEYKVVTNMFSAEYGLATGSQSVLVSKGGSNQFHGDAFEYLRNSALDANPFFSVVDYKNARKLACDANGDKLLAYPCDRIPPFKQNNFGGSFGGPIKKDKTFVYGVYEGLRRRESPVTTANTFPIGCYVDGSDMLHTTLPSTIDNNVKTNPYDTVINGTPTACTKPTTANQAAGQTTITVGGGNPLALAQIQQIVGLYPLPLPGLGGITPGYVPGTGLTQPLSFNYQFPFTQPSREDYEQVRLDENISSKDTAFLRYTVDWSTQNPNGSFPQWYDNNKSLSAIGTFSETHIFTPTVLNQARVSFSRTDLALGLATFTGANGSGTSPNPGGVLIPGREDSTGITPGSSTLPITAYGTGGGNSSGNTVGNVSQNIWQVSDDIFWNKGKHAFKFGTLINHYTGLFRVNFTYRGTLSYSTLDNFFQDQYASVSAPSIGGGGAPIPAYITNGTDGFGNESPQDRRYWWNTLGFYIQDDFRVKPRVTLNLGLRYEFNTLPQAPAGLAYTVLDPSTYVPCTIPNGQYGCAGPANGQGTPGGLWGKNNSLHNFSPRVGFAWDVFGDGKTALRGGGAIMYDIADLGTSIAGNATGDPSLSALESISITGYTAGTLGPQSPIPLTIAGLSNATCTGVFQFTPTCPANSFQNLGAFPCSAELAGGATMKIAPLSCPAGEKITVALTSRVADYSMAQPKTGEWNLTVDRQLPFGMDLTVSYVGTKAWHVMQTTEGNPTMATGIGANGVPYFCTSTAGGEATAATGCVTNSLNSRPNPNLGPVQYYTAGGDAYYHALQASLQKRLSNGLSFQVAYTFAKALDDGEKANADSGSSSLSGQSVCGGATYIANGAAGGSQTVGAVVPCVMNIDKGPTFFDIRHNLRVNVIYHVPDVKSEALWAKPLHGWWLGDITSFQTGFPINITDGTDRSLTSNTNTSGSRPNLDASYNPNTVVTGNPNQWFNTTMFDLNPPGTFGNSPRDGIRGPRLSTSNISINKDTRVKWLGEAGMIEFRAELFNAFNHPNFLAPGGSLGYSSSSPGTTTSAALGNPNGQFADSRFAASSPANGPSANGGAITSTTGTNRQIQLDLKVIF